MQFIAGTELGGHDAVETGGCAGPCVRQAKPRSHPGRHRKGLGPKGEGSEDWGDPEV